MVALRFEELRVLQAAETVADEIWQQVVGWDSFSRETVGGQMARAGDSIGAHIAEAYGRFHFGEKLQFLYYARGSLFETKYWLNRAQARDLIQSDQVQDYATQLTDLARQLNAFASGLKAQRRDSRSKSKVVREPGTEYAADSLEDDGLSLFTDNDLSWLAKIPNIQ